MFFLLPAAVQAQGTGGDELEPPFVECCKNNVDQVNLRAGPNASDYEIVGLLVMGETCKAVGQSRAGLWIQILYAFGARRDGLGECGFRHPALRRGGSSDRQSAADRHSQKPADDRSDLRRAIFLGPSHPATDLHARHAGTDDHRPAGRIRIRPAAGCLRR